MVFSVNFSGGLLTCDNSVFDSEQLRFVVTRDRRVSVAVARQERQRRGKVRRFHVLYLSP